jgi:hypothetical protein
MAVFIGHFEEAEVGALLAIVTVACAAVAENITERTRLLR